jgi:phosphoglycolate phosphatase
MTQTVIWDWNGTLLNDLDFCISTINQLLKKRRLSLLNKNTYKEVFSFPVQDYYRAIGFDFSREDFSVPAKEFIDLYNNGVHSCQLHTQAIEVLRCFQQNEIRQFVLSAMKQNMLERTLKANGIFGFFDGVAGLSNHYAVSKVERGEQLLKKFKLDKSTTTIIGDTTHDYEVAQALGLNCILIADGHQSRERLQKCGAKVIVSLNELLQLKCPVKD